MEEMDEQYDDEYYYAKYYKKSLSYAYEIFLPFKGILFITNDIPHNSILMRMPTKDLKILLTLVITTLD